MTTNTKTEGLSSFSYPIELNLSLLQSLDVEIFHFDKNSPRIPLPIFGSKVAAGFPSPADDYIEKSLDLNELLIQNPPPLFSLGHKMNQC